MKIVLPVGISVLLGLVASVWAQDSETGELGVYPSQYRGRSTASGEPYNPDLLTAAHHTLPLGTMLRVANFETGRMVDVRVNDRKASDSVLLTLSKAAADRIGLVESMTAPGSTLVITPPAPQAPGSRAIAPAVPLIGGAAQPAERKFQPFANLKKELAERKASASASAGTGIKKGLFGKPQTVYGIPASQYQPYVGAAAPAAVSDPNTALLAAGTSKVAQPKLSGNVGEVIPLSAPARARVAAIPAPEVPIAAPKPAPAQPAVGNLAPYRVQFGAFRRMANAQELQGMLGNAGIPTFVAQSNATGLNLVLTQGGFNTADEAQRWIDFEAARRRWTQRPVVIR